MTYQPCQQYVMDCCQSFIAGTKRILTFDAKSSIAIVHEQINIDYLPLFMPRNADIEKPSDKKNKVPSSAV